MNAAQMTGMRQAAQVVVEDGRWSLVSKITGRVMMFGLTRERAESLALPYGAWAQIDRTVPMLAAAK